MKLANPDQMKIIDQKAIGKFGIPGILLMETAAQAVAEKVRKRLGSAVLSNNILVVAGKGNNGGDAFATARHLYQWGYPVKVVSLVPREKIKGDPGIYLQILERLKIPVVYICDDVERNTLGPLTEAAELIVDGIFGTGIHGEVTGFFAEVIRIINDSGKRILSIDIPSGINGETGQVCGTAIKADGTVTFSLLKPGILQYPGKKYAGEISLADIGIPQDAIHAVRLEGELMDAAKAVEFLPERKEDGHKGTFGRVLIITGSKGMTGSGTLAATSAFKTGSGLVYLAVPETLASIYNITIPEAITLPLHDEEGILVENPDYLNEIAQTMDVVVMGPGLSKNPLLNRWVGTFVTKCKKPMVIDADALNMIAENPDVLLKRAAPTVITPHPGEFSRLTGDSVESIQKNRIKKAIAFSRRYLVTVVLKGAGTVIAYPDGKYRLNHTGHPGMAVAGSGDVLCGMIGSLIGQGVYPEQAAVLGVFLHGKCGEHLARENMGQAGFTAGELCRGIPRVIAGVKTSKPKEMDGRWISFEYKNEPGVG